MTEVQDHRSGQATRGEKQKTVTSNIAPVLTGL
jgi:hypothetical protein